MEGNFNDNSILYSLSITGDWLTDIWDYDPITDNWDVFLSISILMNLVVILWYRLLSNLSRLFNLNDEPIYYILWWVRNRSIYLTNSLYNILSTFDLQKKTWKGPQLVTFFFFSSFLAKFKFNSPSFYFLCLSWFFFLSISNRRSIHSITISSKSSRILAFSISYS